VNFKTADCKLSFYLLNTKPSHHEYHKKEGIKNYSNVSESFTTGLDDQMRIWPNSKLDIISARIGCHDVCNEMMA
jgi:hypothetical protein